MSFKYYQPILAESALQLNKPVRVMFGTTPVVLIKQEKSVFAYEDICPHRGVALSAGKIIDGQIQCPYHGWKFSIDNGINTFVPVNNTSTTCKLKPIFVKTAYNIVWLSFTENALFPSLSPAKPDILLTGAITASRMNVLENFLEGSHTHYVHNGLVRTDNKMRNEIKAELVNHENGFTVNYEMEPAKGLLTKLLPKKYRNLSPQSSYIHPNIAILEYTDASRKVIARFEAILMEEHEQVRYIARILLNIGWIGQIIAPITRILFKMIITQDKRILEMQQNNLNHFKENKFISEETDMVGKYIYAWQSGNNMLLADKAIFKVYW